MSQRPFFFTLFVTLAAFAVTDVAPLASAQPAPKLLGGAQMVLHGAGATFPAPLYKKWFGEYAKTSPAVAFDYKEVGSGEGVKRFLQNAVDFGASDAAMNEEEIARAKSGVTLVPATAGMVVLAYNLPGLQGTLKLDRSTYLDLLTGSIQKWNDARLQRANPDFKLPNKNIVLVARQDSSGTTFALTNHLNALGDKWRASGRGVGTVVGWPGNVMLVRGNEGVAARIKISDGSIGYVEYGFAKRLGLPMAQLENRAGRFVAPNAASGQAALAANLQNMPGNLRIFLPDPDGENSYPIVSLSWLLLYKQYPDPERSAALKRFVTWALTAGQPHGVDLGYIALPAELVERSRAATDAVQ